MKRIALFSLLLALALPVRAHEEVAANDRCV